MQDYWIKDNAFDRIGYMRFAVNQTKALSLSALKNINNTRRFLLKGSAGSAEFASLQ
jgi:hypothetical protein